MVENENIDNTNSNDQSSGGRRRRSIFGGRRVSRPAGTAETPVFAEEREVAAEQVAVEQAPEESARAERAPADTPAAATEKQLAAAGAALGTATGGHEPPALPDRHGEQPEAPVAYVPGLPPTTLLFQAPDILPLPPLPDDEPTGSVRRRSRRRAGENGRNEANDPANTVVKVRTPREPELITEPQKVKGSTRLEAKKQRRRDGRDAGRRRPVITEAEFLARRESVDRQMVVRSKGGRIQIGVLEDKVLVEHYVARSQEASLIGNVYLGRVQNVLPSMEAAFVDIGRGRNAVLYSGEVDWDAVETGNQPRRIELALKAGDRVLVQVTKDPVGHKGARLTSQISLPGRYLVYVPNGSMNGISRKLPDTERSRLKKILKEVLPENAGVIVRTAAEGATEEQLTLDVTRLTAQWGDISRQVEAQQAPALLHSEPDLLIKIIRDVFNEDFQKLVIAGDDARQTIESYLRQVAPDLIDRVEAYAGDRDAFDEFRITEQIEKALERKVWLPSGGSLVIDRTEAMTVVDVNTGKFVGSGGNLEETVTKNNLEAAEEIVRQLRLRDIGGIIVVDFIDMVLESNRDLVLRRLIECLSRDRTKHQVAEVTSLGLVQMTRKKLGLGLLETFSEACEVCAGRGVIVHHDPVVKHRQPQQQPQNERRRGRGGNGGGQAASSAPHSGNGTHAITDDAKNALAQIAASTLHLHHEDEGSPAGEATAPAAESTQVTPKKRRRKSKGQRDEQRTENPEQQTEPAQAPAEAVSAADAAEPETIANVDLPLIDLPVPTESPAHAPAASAVETAILLDSVLDALPNPQTSGQGRSRGRRASTAVITGGELAGDQRDS
ncbi:Rne/Rng family ribonuclease [Leifsonia sp. McL0607]|uniref:Rne/Rng family ribonuclease n=1 Tax=Leifsonia sp. McL0607 TaxID=3415672 RepID=UPI003CEE74DC